MTTYSRLSATSLPGKRFVAAGVGAEEAIPAKTENENPEPEPETGGHGKGPRRKAGIGP
jgi:hypothetical protein